MEYVITYKDAKGNKCVHGTIFDDREHARQIAKIFHELNKKEVFAWAIHILGAQVSD